MFNKILLCTHGSAGAQKAEKYVFTNMYPNFPEAQLTVLTIVDKDWSIMSSDDWLNTSTTRTQFKDYVDEQLAREIGEDWDRIKETYPLALQAKFIKVAGGIEETIAEVADKISSDVIVLGPFYKKPKRLFSVKMAPGLADTLSNEELHPLLPCPILTVP
ncbi:MAG: universal stress protein [Desulfobulbaceae bacterium]|nr:universal stress protein [Desulfobulbaceae bacterium]